MSRPPRNLSGCYFRYRNPETGRFENWCYEDLPREERERQLAGRSPEWIVSLVHILADTVVKIGDTFDLAVRHDDDPEPDGAVGQANDGGKKHGG